MTTAAYTTWNRNQNRTVIDWAINNIFEDWNHYDGDEDDPPPTFKGPLRRVFDNHKLVNWYAIITLRDSEIDGLHYYEDTDKDKQNPIPIIAWQKSRLYQLIDCVNHLAVATLHNIG